MRISLPVCLSMYCAILAGCSAGIVREGYDLRGIQGLENFSNCRIAIKKNAQLPADEASILGRIKVYDTQFSFKCDEAFVLGMMKKEACALGAHVIDITDEKRPDFWSTCYRASAQFLRLHDTQRALSITSDAQYEWPLVEKRGAQGRKRQGAVFSGVVGGAAGGSVAGH